MPRPVFRAIARATRFRPALRNGTRALPQPRAEVGRLLHTLLQQNVELIQGRQSVRGRLIGTNPPTILQPNGTVTVVSAASIDAVRY